MGRGRTEAQQMVSLFPLRNPGILPASQRIKQLGGRQLSIRPKRNWAEGPGDTDVWAVKIVPEWTARAADMVT